jgi:hypothetical protein
MTVIRNFMSHPKKKQLSLYCRHLGSTALMRLELQRIMEILSVGRKLFEVAPSRQQKRKISIRHPDVTSLDNSNLNDKLLSLQLGEHMQYAVCDSAYIVVPDNHMFVRHNSHLIQHSPMKH